MIKLYSLLIVKQYKSCEYIHNYIFISIFYVHLAALLILKVFAPNFSPSKRKDFLTLYESKHNPKATHFD